MSEGLPCVVCGKNIPIRTGRPGHQPVVCDDCRGPTGATWNHRPNGWRAKTCPSCGIRPIHHRDYTSNQYKKHKILKCGWCRKADREGPDPWAP